MIDVEALLQPVEDGRPSGVDLRLLAGDTTFRQLAELRREVDPALDPEGQAKSADWPALTRACSAALRERSKDLELAAYLTQALARTDGFPGLAAGLRFVRELIARYWDTVHPGNDEGEIVLEIRARPLAWLGGARDFLNTVKQIPLAGAAGDTPRSWSDYEQSRRVDEAARRSDRQQYQELIEGGLITGEQWQSALVRTPPDRLAATREAIAASVGELSALRDLCEEKFGADAPHLLDLRNLLEEFEAQLARSASGEQVGEPAAFGDAAAVAGRDALAAGAVSGAGGPIATRAQAYRQLREIADFLRRTEPHSPVSLLVGRAVKWGELPFEALFEDFVKNEDARNQVRDLLGLGPSGEI